MIEGISLSDSSKAVFYLKVHMKENKILLIKTETFQQSISLASAIYRTFARLNPPPINTWVAPLIKDKQAASEVSKTCWNFFFFFRHIE